MRVFEEFTDPRHTAKCIFLHGDVLAVKRRVEQRSYLWCVSFVTAAHLRTAAEHGWRRLCHKHFQVVEQKHLRLRRVANVEQGLDPREHAFRELDRRRVLGDREHDGQDVRQQGAVRH